MTFSTIIYIFQCIASLLTIVMIAVALAGWIYRKSVSKDRTTLNRTGFEVKAMQNDDIRYQDEWVDIKSIKLYRQSWESTKESITAIVVFVHGIDGHGGLLARNAEYICSKGIKLVAYDLRGHGRSDGIHGYVENIDQLVSDLRTHIGREKKRHKTLPVFVMGASFGGLVTLQYMRAHTEDVSGFILMCPLIEASQSVHPSSFVILIGRVLRIVFPELAFAKAHKDCGFSDPQIQKELQEAELVYHGRLRIGTGFAMKESFENLTQNLHEIAAPFIVLHGNKDSIVPIDGSLKLMKNTVSTDATMKTYENCEHALLGELMPQRMRIINDFCEWIKKRCNEKH